MPQLARSHHRGGARASLYEDITSRIIAELEAGRLPWVQPWEAGQAAVGLPYNIVSDRRYSGINILTLWQAVLTRGFQGHCGIVVVVKWYFFFYFYL